MEFKLVDVLLSMAVLLLGFVLRELLLLKVHVQALRIVLTGENGQNGVKGDLATVARDVEALEERSYDHAQTLTVYRERIQAAERDIKDLKGATA